MNLSNKRVLVIGGAGLIGSHIVDALVKTPVGEIIIFDNFSRGTRDNLESALEDPRVRIFSLGGDILQRDILEAAMEGVDGVFHLAALWLLHCQDYPDSAFEVNVRGTYNVAMAAIRQKVKRLVYSSSASVYGDALQTPMTEEHPYNNRTFYGATKIAGEHLFRSLGERFGLPFVGLRYMNVYGPRQDYHSAYTAVMHKILDCIEQGEAPVIYGDGSQTYDFIHVHDVAQANLAAMQSRVNDEFYNVGRGIGTSLRELAELLLNICGSDLPIRYEEAGETFVTHRIGSPDKASQDLHWTWKIDLEEGMRDLVSWRQGQKVRSQQRRLPIQAREISCSTSP